ncbi:hypothetical protein V8G54_029909 [Vigna mungo]|uniref:Uncharacterized protein n=1 Tax=Vigna mungo TaxID=3915 RepID=A0AAQ3RJL2_VIGMU
MRKTHDCIFPNLCYKLRPYSKNPCIAFLLSLSPMVLLPSLGVVVLLPMMILVLLPMMILVLLPNLLTSQQLNNRSHRGTCKSLRGSRRSQMRHISQSMVVGCLEHQHLQRP